MEKELNHNTTNEENTKQLRFNPDEIKYNLKKVFFNFGQFQVKENEFFISFQGVNKILKTIGIIEQGILKPTEVDILLKKINSKSPRFNEKQFLDFLVLVAEKSAPELFKKSRKLAIEAVYRDFIYPLCKEIDLKVVSAEEMNSGVYLFKAIEDFVMEYKFSDFHFIILNDIVGTLYEIYKAYFYYENNLFNDINKILEGSLKDLIIFAREFEIVPYKLSYNQLVIYYNIIISKILMREKENEAFSQTFQSENNRENNIKFKNEVLETREDNKSERFRKKNLQLISFSKEKIEGGKLFKFKYFLEMIIHLSEISFSRLAYSSYSNMKGIERFLVFLEKLQSSKGFQNFERKTSRPHCIANTLVPNKQTIEKLDENIINEFKFGNPEVNMLKLKGREIKEIHNNSNNEQFTLKDIIDLDEENLAMLEQKLSLLKDVFISYTGSSDKMSFMKLNYSSFLKFLKDSKLVDSGKEATMIRSKYKNEEILSINNSPKKNKNYRMSIYNFADTQKGKITETDASLIFQALAGPKNKYKEYNKDDLLNKDSIENKVKGNSSIQSLVIDRKTQVKTQHTVNRLDFHLFLKSLEMISLKLYPSSKLNYAFKQFLLIDMKGILENRRNVSVLYSQQMIHAIRALKDEKIVVIIQLLHDVLLPMFQNYCDNGGFMTFEHLFDFYKDFHIFPEIVNLIQLKNIFFVLSESLVQDSKAGLSSIPESLGKIHEDVKGKFS